MMVLILLILFGLAVSPVRAETCGRCSVNYENQKATWQDSPCKTDPPAGATVTRVFDASCNSPSQKVTNCQRCSTGTPGEYVWWTLESGKTCDDSPGVTVTVWRGPRPECTTTKPIDPQYIFVRKNPMSCDPGDCSQLWNMTNNSNYDVGFPDVVNGVGTRGTDQRKLGVGVQINYNLYTVESLKTNLLSFLASAKKNNVPVEMGLEGFQWWGDPNDWSVGTPELWNWWDTSKPGYNADNVNNVEWTCWDPSCALKKGYRNWFTPIEVRPPPNLGSRRYIENNKAKVKVFADVIANWYYNELGADQKWLLGGITTGVETDIGWNGTSSIKGSVNSDQQGYGALKALGIRTSGGKPTVAELDDVVNRYTDELNKVLLNAGIPRNKVFNHTYAMDLAGGSGAANGRIFQDTQASVMASGFPGWSNYGGVADNPKNYSGINSALDKTGSGEWSSPEWGTGAATQTGWESALKNTLNYRNNRFLNISNWEEIRSGKTAAEIKHNTEVRAAIKNVLNEAPACWVTPPNMIAVAMSGSSVVMNWSKGNNNTKTYLNVSNSSELSLGGTLKNINVINDDVTTVGTYSKTMNPGKYYWTLVTDGCNNQRKISYGNFTVTAAVAPTATPVPPTPTMTPIPPTPTKVPPTVKPTLAPPTVPGDASRDGIIDLVDFGIWKEEFLNKIKDRADLKVDGVVDMLDFEVWKQAYLNK